MLKVLIIDDEPFISKGLSEKIDWPALGCEICGMASNGYEGKKLINQLKPDIVVSDIVMPGHTGLELAEFVHQNHKDILMILLSGYDEFTFAKEAFKYGVFDYLLKPTVVDEVMAVIKNAVNTIEQKRDKEKNYEYLENALQESIPIIEQSLLYEMTVKGIVPTQNIKQSIDLTPGKGAVITVEMDSDIQNDTVTKSIKDLLQTKNMEARFVTNDQKLLVIPSFSLLLPDKVVETRLKDIAEHILSYFSFENRIHVSMGIGGMFTSINTLHSSYLQSIKALSRGYFVGKGKIHIYSESSTEHFNNNFSAELSNFIEKFEEWELEKILLQIEGLFKELKYTFDRQLVLNLCLELLIKLGLIVAKWDKNFSMTVGYEQLERCKTFEQLLEFMKQTCVKVKNHLYETMNKNNLGVVEQAKRIIEQQYGNPDLNAQFIAEQLDVSVSYLSRTFKKDTGENLSNFLTEKRIQEAQKLLTTTDLKANEVSIMVGFLDARYFGQVFKKIMRTTPSEYKKCK
ncbi:two-component system response regulator YesN [Neobacillus niacini]|uniref:response regulator n=1 Tax=Neobacillus driksii TaxID=3035913 RepID=UPI00278A78B7|nr:response regulator [Neobacillus niacini]MDQ0970375.1 two-component system response regulator YesN [Neobacillus niacini]